MRTSGGTIFSASDRITIALFMVVSCALAGPAVADMPTTRAVPLPQWDLGEPPPATRPVHGGWAEPAGAEPEIRPWSPPAWALLLDSAESADHLRACAVAAADRAQLAETVRRMLAAADHDPRSRRPYLAARIAGIARLEEVADELASRIRFLDVGLRAPWCEPVAYDALICIGSPAIKHLVSRVAREQNRANVARCIAAIRKMHGPRFAREILLTEIDRTPSPQRKALWDALQPYLWDLFKEGLKEPGRESDVPEDDGLIGALDPGRATRSPQVRGRGDAAMRAVTQGCVRAPVILCAAIMSAAPATQPDVPAWTDLLTDDSVSQRRDYQDRICNAAVLERSKLALLLQNTIVDAQVRRQHSRAVAAIRIAGIMRLGELSDMLVKRIAMEEQSAAPLPGRPPEKVAYQALVRIGTPAVGPLLAAYPEANQECRDLCIGAIQQMYGRRAARVIVAAAADDDSNDLEMRLGLMKWLDKNPP